MSVAVKFSPGEKAAMRDEWQRAVFEAQKVLKPGDRIRARRACHPEATYTFMGWDGEWIITRSGYTDVSAPSIVKVNGEAMSFGGAAETGGCR
jgi:hypothetical protein